VNTTLAKFMQLAAVVAAISYFLWDKLMGVMGDIADKVASFIS
jgi:F0F1-type ATP synthase membrane subunit b/b'